MSFRNAADELGVTPTAVSHRIRSLEEWLGVKLFNRLTRSLELTKEGEAYVPLIRDGFALLASASDALKQSSEGGELVISTTMSFASNWLSPKLPFFYEQHDDLRLRIEGSDLIVDFTRTNIDVAIRYGEGGYEDLHSEMLFTDLVTPVCAPELAARAQNQRTSSYCHGWIINGQASARGIRVGRNGSAPLGSKTRPLTRRRYSAKNTWS